MERAGRHRALPPGYRIDHHKGIAIVISAAASDYAPAGRALVSSSMVHGSVPRDPDGREVRQALARLHGTDTSSWELVATYDLPHALRGCRLRTR